MPEIKGNASSLNKNKKFLRINPETDGDDIVISGMSGKFPNCHNIAEFEYKLYNKVPVRL